jgi:hypothetical protein
MQEDCGVIIRLGPVSPTTPVPEMARVSGLPIAVFATVTEPEVNPLATGLKVTLIEQLDPGPSTPELLPPGKQLLLMLRPDPVEVIDVIFAEVD